MKIKFVQLNTWLGGTLWEPMIAFIKAEKPDIITLQEVYNGTDPSLAHQFRTFTEFQKLLNLPYSDFAPTFRHVIPEGKIDMGNALFSKFPIIDRSSRYFVGEYRDRIGEEEGAYAALPRNLEHITLNVNGTDLTVVNVHGIVDFRGEYDSPERLHMSQVIIEEIKNKERVIVAGDFNVSPTTETIHGIEQHLTNAFKDELTTSFNMRRKTREAYATAVVDMLFVSPTIKVLEHSCPDVDVSDHRPLVATLEI